MVIRRWSESAQVTVMHGVCVFLSHTITFKVAKATLPMELAKGFRQRGQLVAVDLQVPQRQELAKGLRQRGQLVAVEVKNIQRPELAKGLRQHGQLVAVEVQALQREQLAKGLRQRT